MGSKGLAVKGPPQLPRWILYTKGATILLSVLILALAAYALSVHGGYSYYYSSGAPGFLIFLAIYSLIVYGGSTVVEIWYAQSYYRVVVLVAYVLAVIFWLSAWAWAASWGSFILAYANYYGPYQRYGSVVAACAGLSAIVWVITIVNLVFFVRACLRDSGPGQSGNVELRETQKPQQTGNGTVIHQQEVPVDYMGGVDQSGQGSQRLQTV
ncbi:hypothetical protein DL766_005210 [Monosporascus sp. MC13-8B]|uniref:MARVEL domain-containing protein n=1 Tax=Monosporascus cannonballus TaxID=155416 RepID=A0ABY0GTN7_9PEZI|nr:hypothetical protein DL763_011264 [Monosporascus cannonballus]RYO77151.1 hypothetical protein DL762_009449 [Monosporascus cannonballus]RYP29784.1 hypothetical protein DL766_005210 [Monosporascus sp. MC13-8B]